MSYSTEKLVGQLIIAGFRGKSIKDDSPIVKFIKDFNLAGVILYDIDLELGGKDLTPGTRNIESPVQLKRLTNHIQNIFENKNIHIDYYSLSNHQDIQKHVNIHKRNDIFTDKMNIQETKVIKSFKGFADFDSKKFVLE